MPLFLGANLDDFAAFEATFAGMSSLTDGDYTVRFHVSGPNIKKLFDILTHGDKPSIAKGTWFAIARLNQRNEAGDCDDSLKSGSHALFSTTTSAQGPQLAKPSPGRLLSQRAAIRCEDPQFRLFLEKWSGTKQMIPSGCHVNTDKEAAMVVRTFCRVESRSHIVFGTEAGDRWENLDSQFIVWKNADKYVEAP